MKTFILVPVYNEGTILKDWFPALLDIAESIPAQVVLIDDGSDESVVDSIWSMEFCEEGSLLEDSLVVLRHEVNCGAGAAIGTGLEYVRNKGAECVLTIDGDGQHDPQDLLQFYQILKHEKEAFILNGSRFLKKQSIPFTRRVANFIGNVVTFLLSGFWVSDSQSGMKGFHKRTIKDLEINSIGYDWCTEVFREANWNHWRVKEVPISVSYTSYSMSKGQSFALGLDMLLKLVIRSLMRNGRRSQVES